MLLDAHLHPNSTTLCPRPHLDSHPTALHSPINRADFIAFRVEDDQGVLHQLPVG